MVSTWTNSSTYPRLTLSPHLQDLPIYLGMPVVPADLSIDARWIVPMNARGRVLENHALVVRDGRILDLLPSSAAAARYAPTVSIERPAHLLMPGMINTHTHAALSLLRGFAAPVAAFEAHSLGPEFVHDGVMAAVAEMLVSGITCFGDRYFHPAATARTAGELGMRAVVGLPVAETITPWASSAAEHLSEALRVRDEFAGHPLISTVFAPHAADRVSDATFARLVTLADELDAGIVIDLHESAAAIERCVALHGVRPIGRLWHLGMLTPALNAVHMAHATEADVELAQRTGISISLGLSSGLGSEHRLPAVGSFVASGIRLGLGTGGGSQDLWSEMKLYALMTEREPEHTAWDALAAATRGGAAVLGLDGGVGTLETGKWADVCCVDLGGPATQPLGDPVRQLVLGGGRDLVSDVWVAGRQLLLDGELTRLDWKRVAARANTWAARMKSEGDAHA
jgi:5-methylthioadenosine/S-adenosylhomocysteine deaminase